MPDGSEKHGAMAAYRLLFIVAAILLLAAAFLSLILEEYQLELRKSIVERNLNDAKVVMAEFQSEMVEPVVIQQALERFSDKAERLIRFDGLTPETTASASEIFLRHFPARSNLLWFSEDLNIITPCGHPEPEQKRAWQAFVKSIVNTDSLSVLEKKIADGFVKSNISDFLSADYFKSLRHNCQQIMYKSESNYIALLKLSLSLKKRTAGYVLALIPTSQARPLWLEERALRVLHNCTEIAGAYILSSSLVVKNSTLSDNLLHGFATEYANGVLYRWQNGVFYYSAKHFANPDILLTVGFRQNREDSVREWLLFFASIFMWLPGLVCLFLPFFGISESTFNWSLKTRFNLTTIAIIALPLITGGVTSAINTARISLALQNDEFNQLEKRLSEVEESIALKTSNFELFLKTEMASRLSNETLTQQTAQRIHDDLKRFGCDVVILITPEGKSWVVSDLAPETIRQKNCYLVSLTRNDLIDRGFAIDVIDKSFPPPTRGLSDKKFTQSSFLNQDFHDRIRRFDLAGTSFSSFVSFVSGRSGKIKASLNLGFNHKIMQQNFLGQVDKASRGSASQLYFAGKSENAVNRLPASKRLRSIIEFAQITGDSFRLVHEWNNNQYLLYTRPFKDIDSVGMVLRQVAVSGLTPKREQLLTLLVTSLAAVLIAALIINFYSGFFLKPLLQLSVLAARVESGDFTGSVISSTVNDEIGVLSNNFGQMIEGLKEKAEMRNYLRADLFEHASDKQKIIAERTEVTILFAGIRNFTLFEDQVSPEEAMGVMSGFLAICEKAVKEHGGDIDKYIGDTAMAAFKQRSDPVSEIRALEAALQIRNEVEQHRLEKTGFDRLTIGIGVASGAVVAGHIGSMHNRLDYTFIGDTVNLAARLEKMAGRNGASQILTTKALFEKTDGAFGNQTLEPIAVKGKAELIDVVTITGYCSRVKA
ncbi:MAG: HAMP domain-containing protein [Candidatus Riflebacteria bacterium]|nr:HAMP domain-containing protein [Candidatus Riflebacteria bacterium]